MKTLPTLAILLCSIGTSVVAQTPQIIGYYPSWKHSKTHAVMPPENVPFGKLSVINYAFFVPKADGTIVGKDTAGDALLLGGCLKGTNGVRDAGSLTARGHANGVALVLSLGGWEDSQYFPVIARNPVLRAACTHSCMQFLRDYGFDGIDVDWEFPGMPEHGGSPADREHFVALMREMRDSLDAAHQGYQLTAAVPSSASGLGAIDIRALIPLLDRFHIMTYDMYGTWDARSGHNAPLYPASGSDPSRCVDAAFRLYSDSLGVPKNKIILGIPFYGHVYTGCAGPGAPHTGADTTHFSSHGAFYSDIAPVVRTLTRQWDDRARVPYAIHPGWHDFISYDDEESVSEKAQYVLSRGAGGVIVWEITGDVMPDSSTPLLDVLNAAFRRTKTTR